MRTIMENGNKYKMETSEEFTDSKSDVVGDPTLVKPAPVRPMLVPQISFSVFASPEAQQALKCLNGNDSDDETVVESKGPDDGNDEEISAEETKSKEEGEESDGLRTRYRWQVVAQKSISAKRNLKDKDMSPANSTERLPIFSTRNPIPPKSARRRMSLSPSRFPQALPNRHFAFSPVPPPSNLQKTISDPKLQSGNGNSSVSSDQSDTSASSETSPTVSSECPIPKYALSRRRLSLPATLSLRPPLMPPRPPSHILSRSFGSDRGSSPTPSVVSSSSNCSSPGTSSPRSHPAVTSLQANREKLERLLRERSRAVARLSVDTSRESSASPSRIRAKHSIPRSMLRNSQGVTRDNDPDDLVAETITSLEDDSPDEDAVNRVLLDSTSDLESSPPDKVGRTSDDTYATLSKERVRSEKPIFRRGSDSFDSGISVNDASMSSVSDLELSIPNSGEMHGISRLRRRRGTICIGSLSTLMGTTPPTTCGPPCSTTPRTGDSATDDIIVNQQRSDQEIEEDVEEELRRRVARTKSQMLMHAAPGSSSVSSAVARLEARANCKSTNGRLRKIMCNLTLERTTAELLVMKQTAIAAARKNSGGLRRARSFDSKPSHYN